MRDTYLSAAELAEALGGKKVGRGWKAHCPAHDDEHPSLSINVGKNGLPVVKCWAGCTQEAVIAALCERGLWPDRKPSAGRSNGKSKRTFSTLDQAIAACCPPGFTFSERWTYYSERTEVALVVARYDPIAPGKKTCLPYHKNNRGWVNADPPGPLPLYRLPELASGADPVLIVEGEKCADAAAGLGFSVTTSAHGHASPHRTDWPPLAGRDVVILPDHDKAGETYATKVAALLHKLDPPAQVKIVRLPGLAEAEDIVDWIGARREQDAGSIRTQIETLIENAPSAEIPGRVEPVLISLADVQPRAVEWLWPGRIPVGKVTLLAGDPSLGKSFVTLAVAATVSRGCDWPDGAPGSEPGSVILLSAEDDGEDTIRPRLDAAGADVGRIRLLTAVRHRDQKAGESRDAHFNLERDLHALEIAIKATPDTRLVVIDPVTAYLGCADSHKNAEIRGLLAPLAAMAQKHRVAIIAVTHLNKTGGARALYRAMGSLAFVAAARSAWVVVADKSNSERRLFLPLKNNLAKDAAGLAYRIIDSPHHPGVGVVTWESTPVTGISADEALAADSPETRTERDDATEFLRGQLAGGPVESAELLKEARRQGLSEKTVRRAKQELGIVATKADFRGPWIWQLPPAHEDGQPAIAKLWPSSGDGGHLRPESPENAVFGSPEDGQPHEDGHAGKHRAVASFDSDQANDSDQREREAIMAVEAEAAAADLTEIDRMLNSDFARQARRQLRGEQ